MLARNMAHIACMVVSRNTMFDEVWAFRERGILVLVLGSYSVVASLDSLEFGRGMGAADVPSKKLWRRYGVQERIV